MLRRWPLPPIRASDDKEARGRVLVVAGSAEVPGAAILAGVAALRVGAGRLVVAAPSCIAAAIAPHLPEARVAALPCVADGGLTARATDALCDLATECDALVCGPGMRDTTALTRAVTTMAARLRALPFVLDAAALSVAPRLARALRGGEPRVILTPHAGEMAKLAGVDRDYVEAHAATCAREMASRFNAVVLLKGAASNIAHPSGRQWRYDGRTPGLATSGSGDVLAGAIAGLLARGAAPAQAAVWGVALHGLAGAALSRRIAPAGFLAREIAGEIPRIMQRFST